MSVEAQIEALLAAQPEPKQTELRTLHQALLASAPGCKLWFLDGTDETGKVVTNPNVGYGSYRIDYANGTSREFYQVGFSANSAGISVYVMGLPDKKALAEKFGARIGKATVTSYCIKFKKLADVNVEVLLEAARYGFATTSILR